MFFCLSNFLFLFQECSVVNSLGAIACLGLFPHGGMVSMTRRRFGKTMVEVVHPGEFRFSEIHKNNSGFWTSRPFGDDSLWPR